MKAVSFQDCSRHELQIQYSGSGDIRIYISREKYDDSGAVDVSLLLNEHQANILVSALIEMMESSG